MPSIRSEVHSSMSMMEHSMTSHGQKLWKFIYSTEVNRALQEMIYKTTAPEIVHKIPSNKNTFRAHIPKLPQIYREMVYMRRSKTDPDIGVRGPSSACSLSRDMSSAMEVLPVIDRMLDSTPKSQLPPTVKEKKTSQSRAMSSEGFRTYITTKLTNERAESRNECTIFLPENDPTSNDNQTTNRSASPVKLPTIFELTATKVKPIKKEKGKRTKEKTKPAKPSKESKSKKKGKKS